MLQSICTNEKGHTMTKRCALIKTKFAGRQYDGERFSRGSMMVVFPKSLFISEDKNGKKTFMNQYIAPFKMKAYPEMAEARKRLIEVYGKSFDRIGEAKSAWRR